MMSGVAGRALVLPVIMDLQVPADYLTRRRSADLPNRPSGTPSRNWHEADSHFHDAAQALAVRGWKRRRAGPRVAGRRRRCGGRWGWGAGGLHGGDGGAGGVVDVAGPDVAAGAGGGEVGDRAVLAAGGVVELAEPVVLDKDLRDGVAQGVAAVDGVAAAGEEVVLDGLVGDRGAGGGGVEADGVGLVEAVEDGVVLDRHRLGAAVDEEAVGVVAGDVAGVVEV